MKKATDDPLTKLADAAFRQAAQKVIKRARESGTPVIIWEDGEVKKVEPTKLMLEKDAHELGLTLDDVRNWKPPEKGGRRKAEGGTKKKRASRHEE